MKTKQSNEDIRKTSTKRCKTLTRTKNLLSSKTGIEYVARKLQNTVKTDDAS